MREGKFIEMNGKPMNIFLEKGKDVEKEAFNHQAKSYEGAISDGVGEINLMLVENVTEVSSDQERVILEVIDAANSIIRKYTKRDIVVQRAQVATLKAGVLNGFLDESDMAGHTFEAIGKVAVDISEGMSNMQLALVLFHELMHLGSLYRIRFSEQHEHPVFGKYKPERSGLSILDDDHESKFFHYLDEALTERLARQYMESQRNNALYVEDFRLKDELFPDADPGMYVEYDMIDGVRQPKIMSAYPAELQAAESYVEHLYKENKDRFSSKEQVWDVFFEAKFTGRLMKLARLIEKTEGAGGFRLVAKQSNKSQKEREEE